MPLTVIALMAVPDDVGTNDSVNTDVRERTVVESAT